MAKAPQLERKPIFQRLMARRPGLLYGCTTGSANAPDLLPRVRVMGSRQFVSLVLQRYDLNLQSARPGSGSVPGEAQIPLKASYAGFYCSHNDRLPFAASPRDRVGTAGQR